jgi:hypothetical protein
VTRRGGRGGDRGSVRDRGRASGAPLILAANRDERLTRASSGPSLWTGEAFVAPRDEEAGGTLSCDHAAPYRAARPGYPLDSHVIVMPSSKSSVRVN